MAFEEEIKLTAAASSTLDAVAVDPVVLACAQGRSMHAWDFLATYYDTPDYLLLRHSLAFRLRRRNNGELCACLKGTGGMVDGVSRRQEWEERFATPMECLGDLPPGELRDQILAVAAPDCVLTPILVTEFHRRILVLQVAESRAEMALDQGEIRAAGAVHPLCEVELERLDGELAPIQTFAVALSQRHPLVPSQRSKFGLGLFLLGMQEDT